MKYLGMGYEEVLRLPMSIVHETVAMLNESAEAAAPSQASAGVW